MPKLSAQLVCTHIALPKIVMTETEDHAIAKISDEARDDDKKTCVSSPEITCSPYPCVYDLHGNNQPQDRSPSPESDSLNASPRFGRRSLGSLRRSISPSTRSRRRNSNASPSGYDQYSKSLLEVPMILDYGDASSDDLSSEWDSDVNELQQITRSKTFPSSGKEKSETSA
ncbi:hypothetical protein Trydic_g20892 [Trypoxylus dichotomus]